MRGLFKDTARWIEREKSPVPSRNQIHDLSDTRHALYRRVPTAAQSQKLKKSLKMLLYLEYFSSEALKDLGFW